MLIPVLANGQSKSYDMAFVPDVWYNDVDGMRLGLRFSGDMEGTFQDGPHRVDAGLWVASKFPDQPISYFLSLTEPIPSLSDFGSEASIQLVTSVRTGYSAHSLAFNKRWQPGFNELDYKELSLLVSQEKLFNAEYRPYAQLWQGNWKTLLGLNATISKVNSLGRFILKSSVRQNLKGGEDFTVGDLILRQHIQLPKGFKVLLRAFGGLASEQAAPEYLYGMSYRQPVAWLQNGVMRAKGTLPQTWLNDGLFQLAGSANLRGYAMQEFEALASGYTIQYDRVFAVNTELVFPNPLDQIFGNSMVGDFIEFRSYIFGDAGQFTGQTFDNSLALYIDGSGFKADAGIGLQFSFNIPDYLGKDRGFALRYEVPLWLSDPGTGENSFQFRNLIGIGAVISL